MKIPNISDTFTRICSLENGALLWGNPEPWVHAELFAEYHRTQHETGWIPFATEVPYVTRYPFQLPKITGRDWIHDGGVKWIDLCLRNGDYTEWYWFELKVQHAEETFGLANASEKALGVYKKDVVALLGFDIEKTATIWKDPDGPTKAYWFEKTLKPYAEQLKSGNHHFVSAFLQLKGNFDEDIWCEKNILIKIDAWGDTRAKLRGERFLVPNGLKIDSTRIGENHLVCVSGDILAQRPKEASSTT